MFISGVDQAQAVLVVGRTEDHKTGNLRPALFIVPTDTPGFTWTKIDMELVSPESQFQAFDDVRLPSDALVGSEDAAIAQLFAGLNPERIMGAASAVGMGRFAINKAVDYVKTRQVWKTPIGAHQGLSHPLAQNHIEVELKLMMQKAATRTTAATTSAPPRRRTWPSTPRARRRCARSTRRCSRWAATG